MLDNLLESVYSAASGKDSSQKQAIACVDGTCSATMVYLL